MDRRSSPRALLRGAAIAFLQNKRVKCSLLDVSAGGLAMCSPTAPPSGSFLRIRFSLAERSGYLDADGTIVRKERRGPDWLWGINFENPQPYVSTQICRYVHKHGSRSLGKNRGATTGRTNLPGSRIPEARQHELKLRRLYKEALDELTGK